MNVHGKACLLVMAAFLVAYLLFITFADEQPQFVGMRRIFNSMRKNGEREEEEEENGSSMGGRDEEAKKTVSSSAAIDINLESIWHLKNGTVDYGSNKKMENCTEKPAELKDKFKVRMESPTEEQIEAEHPELMPGGHWRPSNCSPRNRVAVIVPFRDREEHLRGFLLNIHGVLQRQNLDYAIFVVEQADHRLTFNKGRLMNAGFLEAQRLYPWECFVFHDVDTVPENDLNLYTCPTEANKAKHMGVAIEKMGYRLLYEEFLGGATIYTDEQYRRANGFSNDFWGWGGEDDDIYYRVTAAGMSFDRNSPEIARYRTFKHETDKGNPKNPCRFEMLKHTKAKYRREGLTSLRYRLRSIAFKRLYTHLRVDVLHEEHEKWKKYIKTLPNC